MNRFRLALDIFFRGNDASGEDMSDAWEKMGRELKGSIFSLLALFLLVSLISYLPIDSFNIFQGRLDHMNNLGGIVGALVAEWFLGTVGLMGFSVVLLTAWLAISAFRGVPFKQNTVRIVGTIITTILAAITCHLLFSDEFPEASLFQGGYVGTHAAKFLQTYFNTTGALLLVGGGFLFTFIITAGLSIYSGIVQIFFSKDEEDEEEEAAEPSPRRTQKAATTAPAPALAALPQAAAAEKAKPARKRKSKKTEGEEPTDPNLANPDLENGENVITDEGDGPVGEFTFKELIPYDGGYDLPSLRLLKNGGGGKKVSRGEAKEKARALTEHLLSFQITGEVTAVSVGPVLTTFEFKPSAGMKLSKIAALQDDLGIIMGTRELRIVAPIPGKTVVGIEIPRPEAEVISLKDICSESVFNDKKLRIPLALGKATDGTTLAADMAGMPHLLVAGATGSGKSVFINSLIMSFLFKMSPQELRLILVDPKMLELNVFDGLPHLISNVITDNKIAFNALSWAVMEMDRRYGLMAQTGSKNIESYNQKQKGAKAKLPYIVIVVDELADLMLSGGEAVEIAITRLAQKARAAGIHLVIATQRPSTDVITGLIKANIPSRISFKVPSGIDSRTILDSSGAEELIGRGDSLMIQPAVPMRRIHGCFVSEEELKRVVKSVTGGKDFSKYYIDFRGTNSAMEK